MKATETNLPDWQKRYGTEEACAKRWPEGFRCSAADMIMAMPSPRAIPLNAPSACSHILAATRVCVEKSQSAKGKDLTQLELDPGSFGNIIDTPDAVLVADKSCAQDVKCSYIKFDQITH